MYDACCGRTKMIDDSLKLKLCSNAVGRKIKGRCYGTGQLACNLRLGSKSPTHGKKTTFAATTNHSARDQELQQEVQQAKVEVVAAKHETFATKNEAIAANIGLEKANNRCAYLEEHMQRMDEKS